ncbi:MAG: hypothetical protein IJ094_05475 [Bacilli bacterium]|nr:hypothetical protein [Bacilli bacterium]
MIKVLEKDYLEDNYIIKNFVINIDINKRLHFNKNNIYYFGNYDDSKINIIKKKILRNKKNIKRAIENNVKFIIHGNSIDIFNNSFKSKDFNLFTAYDKKEINIKRKKLKLKHKNSNKYIIINDLKKGIDTLNFRYKNLICIK